MSQKANKKTKILNFLTFGYVNKKAKEISQKVNSEIKTSENSSIDVESLIKFLGGFSNIISVSSTLTVVKVNFKNKSIIDVKSIKNIGTKGIILSENCISMVFGDSAKFLAHQILDSIK